MNTHANSGSFTSERVTKNLRGRKFGRLSVIERKGSNRHNSAMWECICDCGKTGIYKGTNLIIGHTKSCGCWAKDRSKHRKHGHTSRNGSTPEYFAWKNMIRRCTNPNTPYYINYGGRGITVCKEWLDFRNFFADVGRRPSDQHSIHRINNDLGYFPSNVKWATRDEQSSNKSSNIRFTFNGKTQTAMQWALEYKMKFNTLCTRIKSGWSIERALTTPLLKRT